MTAGEGWAASRCRRRALSPMIVSVPCGSCVAGCGWRAVGTVRRVIGVGAGLVWLLGRGASRGLRRLDTLNP